MELELNVFPAVDAFKRTVEFRQLAFANFIKTTVDKVNEAIKLDSGLGSTYTAIQVEYPSLRSLTKSPIDVSPIDVLYELFSGEEYEVDINIIDRKGVPHLEIQVDWEYALSGAQEAYSR